LVDVDVMLTQGFKAHRPRATAHTQAQLARFTRLAAQNIGRAFVL